MRRIAIINQKGGVGKTTTCANLGAALALSGRRVVLVDMDAQANLTLSLNTQPMSGSLSSYSVLTGGARFGEALRNTSTPNLSLLPADIDLSGAELELAAQLGREHVLREAVEAWEVDARQADGRAPADYVFFDCPPSLGLLSVNALAAAGEVLIVIQTEFLALQGMSKLVDVLKLLKKRLNPKLEIAGIVPCLYDSRLKLAREVLAEIRGYFPGKVGSSVRSNVKLAEAPSFGRTIFEYAPESNGARDYLAVAREIALAESRDPDLSSLPPIAGTAPRPRAPEVLVSAPIHDASGAKAPAESPAEEPASVPIPGPSAPKKTESKAPAKKKKVGSVRPPADSAPLATVVLAPKAPPPAATAEEQSTSPDAFQALESGARRG